MEEKNKKSKSRIRLWTIVSVFGIVIIIAIAINWEQAEVSPQGLKFKINTEGVNTETCKIENARLEPGQAVDLAKAAGLEQGVKEVGVRFLCSEEGNNWEISSSFEDGDYWWFCKAKISDETSETLSYYCSQPDDSIM